MNLEADIIKGLQARFQFRKTRGDWMQEGTCPQCNKREAYCSSKDPKIVRCGRQEKCGWEDSVRNQLPDLFENWSKRFPVTEQNPNAAADAYLLHERGLDLQFIRGSYSQELFQDPETKQTGATVRFKVGETFWERIIDRPGRFEKKAHFRAGGKWRGHVWMPPKLTIADLIAGDEVWIAEGIFDACALHQVGINAVSAMSVNVWPEHFLDELRAACDAAKLKQRPTLVFAFDVGAAGVSWTRKFVAKARDEGWPATAAQVRPDGEGTKLDWNDLLLRHQNWKGDPERAPLSDAMLEEYLYNGQITVAETARDKAKLIYERTKFAGFDFRHDNRLFSCKVSYDAEDTRTLQVEEIANCAFRLLYRERDEIADDTNYFLQIDFPDQPTVKARFSNNACANSGEFKKRLMAFAGMWSGSGDQLDRLMRKQTRRLKVVEPVPFTGYSSDHRAWIFGEQAVREGRLVSVNSENYFDFGKSAVKLRSPERILDINYDPDRQSFNWVDDLWTAYGPKGLIALSFFTMSLFAVQIRERHKSLGFLEITGLPGSGKSTLVEFLWKLMGRSGYEGFDPNKGTTVFLARSLMKVSNLPVGLIEGGREDDKRGGYRQFDYNELLVLYNGRSPRGTGQKSGGFETSEPPFLGAIYLMQNERIDAIPAVLERLMSMDIDKSRWSPATKDAALRLEGWPIDDVSGTIIHVVRKEADYLPYFFERFSHHDSKMADRVPGLINARPIKCHSQLAAGVEALAHLFPNCRPEWIEETLRSVDRMALDRQQSCGGDHPLVADFWEKVDYLLEREKPEAHAEGNSVNQSRNPAEVLAINLPHFEVLCKTAGFAVPDMQQLKKLLSNSKSRKFIAKKNVNSPAGRSMACWVFAHPMDAGRVI